MSILPSPLPPHFKLLGPYITTPTNPPRHTIAYGATNNDGFFNAFNGYVLQVCQAGSQYQALLSFWASITAEAVAGRLDLARSGRKEIQRQRQEDVLLKILPLLRDGLSMHESPDIIVACFTLAIILASKSQLADVVLDGLMEAVTGAIRTEIIDAGLICLSILTQQKSDQSVPKKVFSKLFNIDNLERQMRELNTSYDMGTFALALIRSAMTDMQETYQKERLDFVEQLLFVEIMDEPKMVSAIGTLLEVLGRTDEGRSSSVRAGSADILRRLNDTDKFSSLVANAVKESNLDRATAEASLDSVIEETENVVAEVDEMDIDSDAPKEAENSLTRILEHIPRRTVDEHSFLAHSPSHLFELLLGAFTKVTQNEKGLQAYLELPLWKSSVEPDEPLFASFFIRVFSGPYSVQVRHAALIAVKNWLNKVSNFDGQAILPYAILQLADPVQRIRRAASEVLLALDRALPSASVDGETFKQWGSSELYGCGKDDRGVIFLPTKDVSKITSRAILPILEESVLDPSYIRKALENSLKSSSNNERGTGKEKSKDMKKYLRQGLLQLFLTHLVSTPLYSVKVRLLHLLANVDRVGAISKRKELMTLLVEWASLTSEDVEKIASVEHLDATDLNSQMCGIVSPRENDAVDTLLSLTSSVKPSRPDFISAITERIQSIWPQLKRDQQLMAADSLLKVMFQDEVKHVDRSRIGRDAFQSIKLSTDVLIRLLGTIQTSLEASLHRPPVPKKRRTKEDQTVGATQSLSEARSPTLAETTFILELVDTSYPERRPELISALFHTLIALHQLKLRDQSDLSYLLSLALGSLSSIAQQAASHTFKVDLSALRLDVVIDCMRTTANSQVQNTALLLIAALASIAPERVLDNIMPVFTFMGNTVLGKDDQYSNYVVDQTMEKVLPPMIESLRSKGQDLIAETSDLISGFTVAYEHIPTHRRLRLYKKLVSNLGDETFIWVLISSLTRRYADRVDVIAFIVSLINTFEVKVQLKTCLDLIAIVQKAVDRKPTQQPADEATKDAGNDKATMLSLLRILDKIFTTSNIRSGIARLNRADTNASAVLMSIWRDLLDRMIRLVQNPDIDNVLSSTASTVLSSFLGLLPIIQFFDVAEQLVDAGPDVVRRKVLRLLESRMHTPSMRDPVGQAKAIPFLQTLYRLLESSTDGISKHAAIACVDRICEIFGRGDVSAVVQAAQVMTSDSCLGASDRKVNILALLSLSSIVELVKDAIVPVVPRMVPKTFDLLQSSLEEDAENAQLHNAAFTLLAALLAQVPFIISDEQLDQMLALSAESKNSELGPESDEIREQALQLIGNKINLTNTVGSLQRTWPTAVENDVGAVQQALSLLTNSVKASAKAVVVNNAEKVCIFLLQAFDLRRIQFTNRTEDSYTDNDVSEVENTINAAAIEIIYKLNDTTFRPIFLRFIDWATKCSDVESSNLLKARKLRQTTLFGFLAHFFNSLKSIVTSYATHFVEPALTVLNDISSSSSATTTTTSKKSKSKHQTQATDPDTLALHIYTLSALRVSLLHDHDAHFSVPTLFTPLADTLTSQLHLSSNPTFAPHISTAVIPTLVALATAVLDTPEHLKALNSRICALRRSESAAVRLASVKTQLALAGDEGALGAEGEMQGEGEGMAEEWCSTVLSVGEGMVYVNEMLEDEDEEVEAAVRRLVRRVRSVVGEEGIFE